jgi:hypothetical protein
MEEDQGPNWGCSAKEKKTMTYATLTRMVEVLRKEKNDILKRFFIRDSEKCSIVKKKTVTTLYDFV